MNPLARLAALSSLLSINLNEGDGGGSGGGEGGADEGGSSGDGKGAGSSGAEGDKKAPPPPPADDAAAKAAAAEADKAFNTKLEARVKSEREALPKAYESWKPKLPDGMPFDEKGFGDFRKEFIEAGLKPEQAQKFIDVFANAELGRLKQIAERLKAETAAWDKTVRADKELAGEDGKQLDATAALARKAMGKFATPAFRELLKSSRLETHPEMLRVMARAGRLLAEDKTDGVREGGGKKELTPKQKLAARYDHPTSKELFTGSDS